MSPAVTGQGLLLLQHTRDSVASSDNQGQVDIAIIRHLIAIHDDALATSAGPASLDINSQQTATFCASCKYFQRCQIQLHIYKYNHAATGALDGCSQDF